MLSGLAKLLDGPVRPADRTADRKPGRHIITAPMGRLSRHPDIVGKTRALLGDLRSDIAIHAICGMVDVTSAVIGAPLTAILIVIRDHMIWWNDVARPVELLVSGQADCGRSSESAGI